MTLYATRANLFLVLLDGWISEIEQYDQFQNLNRNATNLYGRRHIRTGVFRVHKYHGSQKLSDCAKLSEFDIILTTYHTLAAEVTRNERCLQRIDWYRVVLDEGRYHSFEILLLDIVLTVLSSFHSKSENQILQSSDDPICKNPLVSHWYTGTEQT